MAKDNISRYVILGMLGIKPMSGYDMKYWISNGVGFFYPISYGQIYPALKSFTEEKLVTCTVNREVGRPEKKAYTITEKGRDELRRWLREPIDFKSSCCVNLLTIKVYFGSNAEKEITIKHISEALKYNKESLDRLLDVEQQMKEYEKTAKENMDNSFDYRMCTLRQGIFITKAQIKWCEEAISKLKKGV